MIKGFESLGGTVVFFGLVSIFIYCFLLRPLLAPPATRHQRQDGAGNRRQQAQQQQQQQRQGAVGGGAGQQQQQMGASTAMRAKHTRVPVHVTSASAKIAAPGGMNLLIDGLLAFRHSKAGSYEQSSELDGDRIADNKKDRARILARLLAADSEGIPSRSTTSNSGSATGASSSSSSSAAQPPGKGSTLVICVPETEVDCSKLRRVLYLLGTYYNLLVILAVDSANKESGDDGPAAIKKKQKELIDKLRGRVSAELPADVLPDHRIVVASTISGRVAFVRQLQRVELVVEFDPEVQSQLSRFGHRVVLYPSVGSVGDVSRSSSVSRLGGVLS